MHRMASENGTRSRTRPSRRGRFGPVLDLELVMSVGLGMTVRLELVVAIVVLNDVAVELDDIVVGIS
jgi:hypothetical protein